MINRRFSLLAAVALLAVLCMFPASAQAKQPIEGTWIVYVTVDGAPPCQCIQISRFHADGSFDGPANDNFSSPALGEWARVGSDQYALTLVLNTIDKDGNASGLFQFKVLLTLSSADAGSGKGTYQILANGGAVVFSGTSSVKMVKVKAQ